MISANRPIINLDLDLLRTFVAVADLNTFAAAAAAVCRTQSAVSQQMQRLEQLVGKELFARHGRNMNMAFNFLVTPEKFCVLMMRPAHH